MKRIIKFFLVQCNPLLRFLIAPIFLSTILFCCDNGHVDSDPLIIVEVLSTQTVLADGTVSSSTGRTDRTYRVRSRVTLLEGAQWDSEGPSASVLFINPENGREQSERATLVSGSTTDFYFDLPGSETLEVCEAMFYRWIIGYDLINAERGIYIGEADYVMPTYYYSGNTLVQALCLEPENPWAF
jgi:hypothetical protein